MTNSIYQHLVSHAADSRPQRWTDLPELSAFDIQLVCAERHPGVAEALAEGEFPDLAVLATARGNHPAVRLPELMEQACRRVLFRDVEKLCEGREEACQQERATARHCRMAGYRVSA